MGSLTRFVAGQVPWFPQVTKVRSLTRLEAGQVPGFPQGHNDGFPHKVIRGWSVPGFPQGHTLVSQLKSSCKVTEDGFPGAEVLAT